MSSELVSVEVDQEGILPQYLVNLAEIPNLQGQIAAIQEQYLSKKEIIGPNSFTETIKEIQSIIIASGFCKPSEAEMLHILSYHTINLLEIYLLLRDEDVTEIFSNKIGNNIIISHLKYGRCQTNLVFTKELWNSLKIRVELDSGRPLNVSQPALKIGLSSEIGNLRISLQTQPLSTLGPTFSIRRLPANAISLQQLIQDQQITQENANYLTKAIQNRSNIIIAGEPGSGKTTLANALLEKSDKSWRLIIMEDAKEISIDPLDFPLLVQYSMPAVGSSNRYSERSNEISRLLHRSPDYVFLGEIQNKDDTKVTFEGFAAGIRGMATTHARNFDGLLTRWTQSHELSKELLASVDIVVITKKSIKDGKVELGISNVMEQGTGGFVQIGN